MSFILSHLNYVAVVALMMAGLFIVFSSGNLIKRMIGLAIFQTSTGLFYISLGKVSGGTAAIAIDAASPEGKALASQIDPAYVAQYGVDGVVYSNPLPHVLILTAIVVGVATLAVGLAIAVRVREAFGTVEVDEIEVLSRVEFDATGATRVNAFAALHAAPPALTAHAPVLMVIGPLVAACAASLAPSARVSWMISVTGSIFAAWMALAVAGEVARRGAVDYIIGGFAPPLGIAFHIDGLGVAMALLISCAGVMTSLYSGHSLQAEVRAEKHTLVQAGFLLCQAGLLGLVSTGDAFNAFVFLEVSSIGTYALVAIGEKRDRRALPAAFNYLIMGTIGATFFVIGVGFLYAATGTLNMADIGARLTTLGDSTTVQAGFAFIVVGLGIKAAMFPLHGWLPGAYSFAPSLVSVFLAATATKASIYLIARFVFDVFPDTAFVHGFVAYVLAPLAATAAIVCSLQAVFEKEIRRMLAFSSVAQVGFILLGLSMATVAGASAGLFYLLAHALMKAALFMALGGLAMNLGARRLDDFAGVARDAPWSTAAFAIAAASLAGAPLTMGFLAKWHLIEAGLQSGQFWIVAVIAIASLITLLYVGRMLEALFFRSAPPGAPRAHEAPVGVLAPLWVLAGLNIWFGIDASLPEQLANAGAQALFGAGR